MADDRARSRRTAGGMVIQGFACGSHHQDRYRASYFPRRSQQAAKGSSGDLMELVIPLIEESLQPPAKEYFEEDGLILYVMRLD